MQRSNDLLDYYLNDTDSFNQKMQSVTEKIKTAFFPFIDYSIVEKVNIMGLSCVFVFNENIKKSKLKFLWMYMFSKKLEVRFTDSTDEEIQRVSDTLHEAIRMSGF